MLNPHSSITTKLSSQSSRRSEHTIAISIAIEEPNILYTISIAISIAPVSWERNKVATNIVNHTFNLIVISEWLLTVTISVSTKESDVSIAIKVSIIIAKVACC